MVALLTPERAATVSMLIPVTPCSAITAMVAWRTTSWSRRGRGTSRSSRRSDADVVEQAGVAERDRREESHLARQIVEGRHRGALDHREVLDGGGTPHGGADCVLEHLRELGRGDGAVVRRSAGGTQHTVEHRGDRSLFRRQLRV